MPKRPRQHQIEDESRIAFRASLPPEWVFRDSVPDYGIDGSVELFDRTGRSTGRLFLVQLKSTDETDLERALVVSFRLEICQYYWSLDLPVLVVLYHAPTRKLYATWFHTFDPYYGRKGRKSITFRLSLQDEWTEETPQRLTADLDALRQIRSPQIPLPVSFRLIVAALQLHGVPGAQIAFAISQAAERLTGVFQIDGTSSQRSLGSIELSDDKVVVALAGKASFTLHTKGYPRNHILSKFPHDVLVAVGLALDHAGHSDIGARMIAEYAQGALILSHPEAAVRMVQCMVRASRVTEALQLSEALLQDSTLSLAAELLLAVPLLHMKALSASERDYFRRFLHRRIELAEKSGDQLRAAAAHCTLANHLRGSHDRPAIRHYKKARSTTPATGIAPTFVESSLVSYSKAAATSFQHGCIRAPLTWVIARSASPCTRTR